MEALQTQQTQKKLNISQRFRKHYGLSQREMADICGKSRKTVINWEHNNACPAAITHILQNILDLNTGPAEMVVKLKQVFDKHVDTKSI